MQNVSKHPGVYSQQSSRLLPMNSTNKKPRKNIFEFDEKTFKQKHGTAIGTKFAPPYAILYMADLEEKLLEIFEKNPMIWWRYIDDIFHLGTW